MQIETYEVTEMNAEGIIECDKEAILLAESLGLEGQKSLISTDADGNTQARMPYRLMSEEEFAVYSALMPNKTRIEEYKDGIIPLRVMQIVAHCRDMSYFDEIAVWHPKAGKDDPVLVGIKKNKQYAWQAENYILARWGETLVPFEEMTRKAIALLKAKAISKARKVMYDAKRTLEILETADDTEILLSFASEKYYG